MVGWDLSYHGSGAAPRQSDMLEPKQMLPRRGVPPEMNA